MIEQTWLLWVIGAACASALMIVMWVIAVRITDASHVDVAWAYGTGGLGVLYAILGSGSTAHRVVVAVLASLWALRLGTYLLLNRIIGKPEDGRYQELRRRWAPHVNRAFFVFFQAQAGFAAVFSLPFLFVAQDDGPVSPLLWIGTVIAIASIALEALADRQLAAWRADPANRGKTARNGLWGWSRHPNYFFDWLVWVGFALLGLASPWGWTGLLGPALMLYFLTRVTGIAATEAYMQRSRGEAYARYQAEVSAFVPRPPARARGEGPR